MRRQLPGFIIGAIVGGLLFFFLGPGHPTTFSALCLLVVVVIVLFSTRDR
jgi:uncharacterized membrane protein YfcA